MGWGRVMHEQGELKILVFHCLQLVFSRIPLKTNQIKSR